MVKFVVIVYIYPYNSSDCLPTFSVPFSPLSPAYPALLPSFAPVGYRNILLFIGSDSQNKFAVSFARIQHPMRLMDIRETVDVGWFGDPISVLDMAYNFLQRHI